MSARIHDDEVQAPAARVQDREPEDAGGDPENLARSIRKHLRASLRDATQICRLMASRLDHDRAVGDAVLDLKRALRSEQGERKWRPFLRERCKEEIGEYGEAGFFKKLDRHARLAANWQQLKDHLNSGLPPVLEDMTSCLKWLTVARAKHEGVAEQKAHEAEDEARNLPGHPDHTNPEPADEEESRVAQDREELDRWQPEGAEHGTEADGDDDDGPPPVRTSRKSREAFPPLTRTRALVTLEVDLGLPAGLDLGGLLPSRLSITSLSGTLRLQPDNDRPARNVGLYGASGKVVSVKAAPAAGSKATD